jgi:hypothetical protein
MDPTAPPAPGPSATGAASPGSIPELGVAGTKSSASKLPEDRSTQFVAVEGGKETTSAEALLVSAYIIMWGLLLTFVFFTWRRQQRMETRVIDLERALKQADTSDSRRRTLPKS